MNVHIPWIKVTLNGGMSLTWRSNPSEPDFFTSLTNKRTVEEATEISLNLTYCPKPGEEINRIEKAIASNPICWIQYGDNYGSRHVTSQIYQGLIYDYTVAFNEGYLSYSLKIVSRAVIYNFTRVTEIKIINGSSVGNYVRQIVDDYLGEWYDFDYSCADLLQYCPGKQTLTFSGGINPIQAIVELIKLIPQKDKNTYLTVEIDDTVGEGAISTSKGKIRVVETTKEPSGSTNISFEWGTKNGTVLEWSPRYSGSVAIFRNTTLTKGIPDLDGITTYDADSGKCVTVTFSQASQAAVGALGTNISNSVGHTMINMNKFKERANYPYEASLTVLGEDRFISPAETKIKVTPVIRGVAHHSAGLYAAKSITDTVNSQGFTTTYDLYRLTNEGQLTDTSSTSSDGEDPGVYVKGTRYSYSDFVNLDLNEG